MGILRPQIEQSNVTQYIPPKGDFETFQNDDHYKEKLKEWGLSSAKEAKREFWYKDRNQQRHVTVKGFEAYGTSGEFNTLVIEFQDGHLSCIHPAYLKEMQQSSFGKESLLTMDDNTGKHSPSQETDRDVETKATETTTEKVVAKKEPAAAKPPKEPKAKKVKAPKLELPAEKVHFTATVKQFALVYNPFNEENDEVVVLDHVQIVQDNPIELGLAWCSHSKTLKKFELAIGDSLEFDGKVTAKKLGKGKDAPEEFMIDVPVQYKVNNPSKIVKK
ncbi:hypothetical protein [Neobacillus jeddahensis]|uniref:hypothetical protein n=1 Tax=Neobacillus jeddahensis TaxID=1461580 RepID=UPI00058ED52C|nr:hypothetical protein [Neobacillus jeddahensis]